MFALNLRADWQALTNTPMMDCASVAAVLYRPHSRGYQGPLVPGHGGKFEAFHLMAVNTNLDVPPNMWLVIHTNAACMTNGTWWEETPPLFYSRYAVGSNMLMRPALTVRSNACEPTTNYYILTLQAPPNVVLPPTNWIAFWFEYDSHNHWRIAPSYGKEGEPESYFTCRYPLRNTWAFWCKNLVEWHNYGFPGINYELETSQPGPISATLAGQELWLSWPSQALAQRLYLLETTSTSTSKVQVSGARVQVMTTNKAAFFKLLSE